MSDDSGRLLDAVTLAPVQFPAPPNATVRGISVARDDSGIAFYSSDGSVPDDLYAGALTASAKRLTNALNPGITRADLVVPAVARFKSYDGVEIPGLLYRPHQASPQSRAPALVMVHGGPGAGEADLGDVVASKKMLIDTGYVDPERIGIIGGSYGGYIVLAALTLAPDAFRWAWTSSAFPIGCAPSKRSAVVGVVQGRALRWAIRRPTASGCTASRHSSTPRRFGCR